MTRVALLLALHDPAIYPDPTTRVEVRETHISVVFLTDAYAYKIKKPLNLGFLDYSTLEQRRYYCLQELLLNRRLSPNVYLEVVAIHHDGQYYTFSHRGVVVEYALKMRRLPADCTLEAMLTHGKVTPTTMETLAQRVADFHRTHPLPTTRKGFGTLKQVLADWQENFAQTADCIGRTISPSMYTQVQQAVTRFTTHRATWFEQRLRDGRIRDCHGDLRAEHIYLEEGHLWIIDCIEFNQRFRFIDVASEVAFLAMDLERLGFLDMAHCFVRAYVQHSGDVSLYRLLDFYCCYRAYVRGKIASIRLHEAPPVQERPRLHRKASQGFTLAAHYAVRLNRPLVLITTGLIGSGKSRLAAAVAAALDLRLFSSDRVRKERAGLPPETPQRVAYGTGMYSASARSQTYEVLADLARDALDHGDSVILDAAFPKRAQRRCLAALAHTAGADFYVLDCHAPETVLRARLEKRMQQPGSISDGRPEIFADVARDYEPLQETELPHRIRLDTTHCITRCLQQALAAIYEGRP